MSFLIPGNATNVLDRQPRPRQGRRQYPRRRGDALGDPKAGEAIYSRGAACHALAYDRTGPRHCGLVGRRAGTSKAMRHSKIVESVGLVDIQSQADGRDIRNPKFVEDLVRDVAIALDREPRVSACTVEAESLESIHDHSAFARLRRPSRIDDRDAP